jgi:hypothetical protein
MVIEKRIAKELSVSKMTIKLKDAKRIDVKATDQLKEC